MIKDRYLKTISTHMRESSLTLCQLAGLLFPLYSFVDYYTLNDFFTELTIIRSITWVLFVLAYFLIKKGKFKNWPVLTVLTLLSLASLSITVMCMVTGGLASNYYAGINLVILAAVLSFPGGSATLAATIAVVVAIYLIGMLLVSPTIHDSTYLINNFSFLISTAFIGIIASYVQGRIRKQSFLRMVELEQTKELLQGELKGNQGNIESLTRELIERNFELDKALSLREEFISLASHELKTPLTSMKLQTEMASRLINGKGGIYSRPFEPNKVLETFDFQIKHLTRIVDNMLDISRIQNGKLEIELVTTDLKFLVENLVNRFKEIHLAKGIELSVHADESVVGNWDAFRIEQVILNLITNAVKYGQGKPIAITIKKNGEWAFVMVKDHGIGIHLEDQTKIFKRFERAVSREFSGLGLGLYISNQIMQAHSGTIVVESELGKGSIFTVQLPLSAHFFPNRLNHASQKRDY